MPKGFNKFIELLKKNDHQNLSNAVKARQEIDKLIEGGYYKQALEHEYIDSDQMLKMASKNAEKFLDASMHATNAPPEDVVNNFYKHSPDFVAKIFAFNPKFFLNSAKISDAALQGHLKGVDPARALINTKSNPELVWQYLNSNIDHSLGNPAVFVEHYMGDNQDIWEKHGPEIVKELENPESNLYKRFENTGFTPPTLSQETSKKMLEDSNPQPQGMLRQYCQTLRFAMASLEQDDNGKLPLSAETSLKLIPIARHYVPDLLGNVPMETLVSHPEIWQAEPSISNHMALDPRMKPDDLWKVMETQQRTRPDALNGTFRNFCEQHEVPSKISFIKSAPPELERIAINASPAEYYKEPAFRQLAMQKLRSLRAEGKPFTMGPTAQKLLESSEDPNEIKTLDQLLPGDSETKRNVTKRLKEIGEYDDPEQVNVSFSTGKIRQLRALAEEKGGVISSADAKRAGFDLQGMGLNPLKDARGNISADKLTAHIEAFPKYQYGISHSVYGNQEDPDPEDVDNEEARMNEGFRLAAEYYREDHANSMPDFNREFDPSDIEENYEQDPNLTEEDNDKRLQRLIDLARINYVEEREEAWNQEENEKEADYVNDNWERFVPASETYENMKAQQRHSHEPSKVLQVNLTSQQIKKMKELGAYETFKDLHDKFSNGNHPYSKGNGIGWVRYTEGPGGVHIDEVQSDFGQNFVKQLKEQLRRHEEEHGLTHEQREHANGLIGDLEKVPPSHYDAINQVMFQGKHPSEVLHEAFLQHMRNTGRIGKNVHIWDVKPKSVLSGQEPEEALPVHMKLGYHDIPKKMGYQPGKYGELKTQKTKGWGDSAYEGNPEINLQGQPTWKQKLVKSINSSFQIGTTTSGKPVFDKFEHEAHNNYDALDHLNAAGVMNKKMSRAFRKGMMSSAKHFNEQYSKHMAAYSEKNR